MAMSSSTAAACSETVASATMRGATGGSVEIDVTIVIPAVQERKQFCAMDVIAVETARVGKALQPRGTAPRPRQRRTVDVQIARIVQDLRTQNQTQPTPHRRRREAAHRQCARRRVDCNQFRYGQCNTQIEGTTEVVCRLMICQNPATVAGLPCNATVMVDDNTCAHEAGCLEGLASQLPGGGGA